MTAQTDDGRLAAIEAKIDHMAEGLTELRTDVKATAATYISRATFDALSDGCRREHENATKDILKRVDALEIQARAAFKAVDDLRQTYAARAWQIAAKLIGTALIALAAYFLGGAGGIQYPVHPVVIQK